VPYHFENGWTFMQRIDVPIYYTDKPETANPGGGWKAGISDIFIEEIFDTPEIMKGLRLKASVRFVFPTGGRRAAGPAAATAGSGSWRPVTLTTWPAGSRLRPARPPGSGVGAARPPGADTSRPPTNMSQLWPPASRLSHHDCSP
jgi:hypothetical protein